MHEASLMANIFNIAEESLKPYRIKQVNELIVSVGSMANVIEDALHFAFEATAPSTIMKGAKLTLVPKPATARCRACGENFLCNKNAFPFACPVCACQSADIISGTEIFLETIDFDELDFDNS